MMADIIEARVLSVPYCPFCHEKEAGLDQLTMHCLARHPLEYILLKRLAAESESANTDVCPNQSPVCKRRRNNSEEKEREAEPTRRVVRTSSECDSACPEPINQTPETVTMETKATPVTEPTGPQAMNGIMLPVETNMPDGTAAEGRTMKEELPTGPTVTPTPHSGLSSFHERVFPVAGAAGMACPKSGIKCNGTHGMCPSSRCPRKFKGRRACWFDHPTSTGIQYFCGYCKNMSKVDKVKVSESGKVSAVTVILADWDAPLNQSNVDKMDPVILIAKKGAQLKDIPSMNKLFRKQIAKTPIQRPKALLLTLGGCDIFPTGELPKLDKIPERMVSEAKQAAYDLGIDEVRILLPPLRASLPANLLEYNHEHQFWANKHHILCETKLTAQAVELGSSSGVHVIPSPIEPHPANFESDGSTLAHSAALRHFAAGLVG